MGFWSTVGAIGGSILLPGVGTAVGAGIGGAIDSERSASQEISSARQTNEWQVALAREQMAWEERMSNTAHQREVEDLRKAGLNPILSANKGASTPQAVLPVVSNPRRGSTEWKIASARLMNENISQAVQNDILLSNAKIARYEAQMRKKDAKVYAGKVGTVGAWLRALNMSGGSALAAVGSLTGLGGLGANFAIRGGSAMVKGMTRRNYNVRGLN